ncbi:MAG: FRG domain-containing protein [Treponema sp.]|nr:FRG domain-containing protein [Treponema sp.]
MNRFVAEKEYHTEINVNDVTSLFTLITNPHKLFAEQSGVDVKGYKTDYENVFNRVFLDYTDVEPQHKTMYEKDYLFTDFWGPFVFRGQEKQAWPLETTQYREYMRLGKKPAGKSLFDEELKILREFQRQYKRFETARPIDPKDYYEWFAVMQHYGAPTRFLDFSYSFYVALYFASNNVLFQDTDTASFSVYAINRPWLEKRYKKFLPADILDLYTDPVHGDSFGKSYLIQEKIVNSKKRPFKSVINMSPFHINSRLAFQKGLFLFPTDIDCPFMENLEAMLVSGTGGHINDKVLKINIELSCVDLIYLYRQLDTMNIGAQTLFENKLDSLGDMLKRKLIEGRYSDVLSLNKQQKV